MELGILNLLLILASAWLGGALANRLGYPSILGELAAGIVLGPALFNVLYVNETVLVLAEVGVLLMMLYIGMEIDYRELGKASWAGLLAAVGGFIVPFGLGYYTIVAFGGTPEAGLFTGIAVGVTSLATKSRILVDLKLLNTRIANVLMAGALISDTLALLIFAGIMSFANIGSVDFSQVGLIAAKATGFFIFAGLVGMLALPKLGKLLERFNLTNRTLYFTIMLAVAFAFSEGAELAGLHHILGAFVAGLFLRDTFQDRRINKYLGDTFHDISIGFLAPIFFVSAGFEVSFDVIVNEPIMLASVLFVATFGKIFGTALFYLPSGNGWREGITVGAGMNGRGAVEIIIAGIALRAGFIDQQLFSILVFMAIFTTATVPVLLRITTEWLRKRGELVFSQDQKKGFLFLGAGPLAEFIALQIRPFEPVTFVDANKENCKRVERLGFTCINGNALSEETLAEAGAGNVRSFVGMTANSEINVLSAQLSLETFLIPKLHVILSPETEDSMRKLLNVLNATSVFGYRVELEHWEHKIISENFNQETRDVLRPQTARELLKHLRNEENFQILPYLIHKKDGTIELFHYKSEIEIGDKVSYLK